MNKKVINIIFIVIFLVTAFLGAFFLQKENGGLAAIFFIILFIIFIIRVILIILLFLKNIAKNSQPSMIFSNKIWEWQEGEKITLNDIWPGVNSLINESSQAKLSAIPLKQLAEGQEGNTIYKAYRLSINYFGVPSIIQGRIIFRKKFPGQLILQRVSGPTIGRDTDLESVEFNKKVLVYTAQPKIAYQILSPDLMEWYLKIPDQPIIIFKDHICYYIIVEKSLKTEKEIEDSLKDLIKHISHSGGLN